MLGNLSRHYWCSAEIPWNPFTNFMWPSCGFPALSLWVETMLLFLGKQPQYTRAFLTEQAKNLKSLGGYFPGGSAGKKIHLQCGRPRFDPWVGKIPWRRERLPTAVFWPGKFQGLCSPWVHRELNTTEQLSLTSPWGMLLAWNQSESPCFWLEQILYLIYIPNSPTEFGWHLCSMRLSRFFPFLFLLPPLPNESFPGVHANLPDHLIYDSNALL